MNCVLFDEYERLCVINFECGMNCVVCMWKQIEILMVSPRRAALGWAKIPEAHPWYCARSRLGELVSPERESISSRRDSLAWARIRSDFGVTPCLESRPGESDSPKRDNSLAHARSSSLSEIYCRVWVPSLFLTKWSCAKWIGVIMAYLVCDFYVW